MRRLPKLRLLKLLLLLPLPLLLRLLKLHPLRLLLKLLLLRLLLKLRLPSKPVLQATKKPTQVGFFYFRHFHSSDFAPAESFLLRCYANPLRFAAQHLA